MTGAPDASRLLKALSEDELVAMHEAGAEALECYRALAKAKSSAVAELLRGQKGFYQWAHYPKGDCRDPETHGQYYYHAHPKAKRPGEHGHFHTFLRFAGMPEGVQPLKVKKPQKTTKKTIGAHLVAISMDAKGFPQKLFTVNRWVTNEVWYPAEDMIRMVPCFRIDHTWPSWATNRWISAIVALFRPQIYELIRSRDRAVAAWQKRHPRRNVFEDRELEVTSEIPIAVGEQIKAIERALGVS